MARGRIKGSKVVGGRVVPPNGGQFRIKVLGVLETEIRELETALDRLRKAREALMTVL